ncbi:hypothetical protein, partial [Weizmannia acidilactici]|uniref:hypothetical protein n=1 Tax=Weizmannia acidilactici TaxID=2607726 RepID=UPI001C12CD5F
MIALIGKASPWLQLASWLGGYARRGSISSCNSLHSPLQNYVFFYCTKQAPLLPVVPCNQDSYESVSGCTSLL